MKRAAVFSLAVACFLWADSAVRAGAISASDYNWGYHFESDGHPLNFITNHNALGAVYFPGSGGSDNMHSAAGKTVDISSKVWAFSTASHSNPQTVTDLPFTVNLKLTDQASGLNGYLSFTGSFNGNLWKNGSTLSPTFTSPLTESVDINHHRYTVAFERFVPPSGAGNPGQFVFDVKVQHNPEPSSLVLAGIGMPLFGLIHRRRRRRVG